jgi:outer membrane biosynthesis protein TonB
MRTDTTPGVPDRRRPARRPVLPGVLLLIACMAPPTPLHAGTPRLQMYFAADFTDQAYQKKTYAEVAAAWKMPAETPKEGAKTVVIVRIQRDGAAPDPTLHLLSGSEPWDKAALDAIHRAAPFDPLPKTHRGGSVEVHFHFEYGK